uniref:Uncharacterized protein n=1 Tax=Alexandrium catenella TaxID=2925 RepID=A0A7S1RG95_ALECA|mmetsp:Transcript_56988/g.152556  ORF Transcript_56988/g.152556 Transcript_56988/m.152556 type:complete len:177 (+) Transcript_56988:44-574(+)
MPAQWEHYQAVRARALAVPPLTADDEDFLNTLGRWSVSKHPNLSFLQKATDSTLASRPSTTVKPRYFERPPEQEKVGYTGFLAMGRPLRDDKMPPPPPVAGSAGDLKMRVTLTRKARSLGSLDRPPSSPPSSAGSLSRRRSAVKSNFEMEPGVPANRRFQLHSPCRDNNVVQTRPW